MAGFNAEVLPAPMTPRACEERGSAPTMPLMLKISVITPSFNQAGFLSRTIDSVLAQTGPFELEQIVIDGGSTDGTVELLQRRAAEDARMRWVSEPDEGQADALNKGVAMAGGEVIGWLNSDDLYLPGALARVAETFAAAAGCQWLYGKVNIIDADDREIRRWITWYKNWRMRRFSYAKLLTENWISQMGVFWRADAGREAGPFGKDLHWCMDYDFWLRLGARWPGRFVDRELASFRWYPTSKSGGGFSQQFREGLNVARRSAAGRYPLALLAHRLHVVKIIALYSLMALPRRLGGSATTSPTGEHQ